MLAKLRPPLQESPPKISLQKLLQKQKLFKFFRSETVEAKNFWDDIKKVKQKIGPA